MAGQNNISTTPIHAEMARALAQAVAGYFGSDMYFTASFTVLPDELSNPYDISPAIFNPDVSTILAGLPDGYGLFGPFDNTTGVKPAPYQDDVAWLQVFTTASPPTHFPLPNASMPVRPDAMFFTAEALAKFVTPYYSSVYTAWMAQLLLAEFQKSELALMIHLPWSESEGVNLHGGEAFALIDHQGNMRRIHVKRHEI